MAVELGRLGKLVHARRRTPPVTLGPTFGQDVAVTMGCVLRAARLARGMTLADVARETGTHRPIVGRTERGLHTPSVRVLLEHAWAVGVSPGEILAVLDEVAQGHVLRPLAPTPDETDP